MQYVSPLSIQREVYCIRGAKNVDHSEILTGFYLVEGAAYVGFALLIVHLLA